jgi:hypothetical protein
MIYRTFLLVRDRRTIQSCLSKGGANLKFCRVKIVQNHRREWDGQEIVLANLKREGKNRLAS